MLPNPDAPRRRKKWTDAEDAQLRVLVAEHGTDSWRDVSAAMLARDPKQCRERWMNHLDPTVRKGKLSADEWAALERLHAECGNKWTDIATHLPGRTANALKNAWHSKMREHADIDADDGALPRRRRTSRARSSSPVRSVGVPRIVVEALPPSPSFYSPAHSPYSPTRSPSQSPALTPTYGGGGLCSSTSSASSLPVLRREDETDELSGAYETDYAHAYTRAYAAPLSYVGAYLVPSEQLGYADAMEDANYVYTDEPSPLAYGLTGMDVDAAYAEDPALMHAFLDTL